MIPLQTIDFAGAQIAVRNVSKRYGDGDTSLTALDKVSLAVTRGEFVCLLGPSGCGKSTLLNLIAGFQSPTVGTVTVDGRPVIAPGPDRGMVFQEYALFPWMTVEQNIAFGLEIKGLDRAAIKARAAGLLEKLKLSEFARRFPKDLSGGMRQRVAIARVLAIDSPVMLMDEPFGALDSLTRRTLQDELLRLWSETGKTVLFVTHSIDESIVLADRIVVLTYRPGRIKADIQVKIARPRDTASLPFNELKRELSGLVLAEQSRHEAAERSGFVD